MGGLAVFIFWLWHAVPAFFAGLPPVELPPPPAYSSGPIKGNVDRIVIDKTGRLMVAFQDGKPVRSYRIALGFAPQGDKKQQGDGKTPEGIFKIDRRNDKSKFYLSLGINYPRPEDKARAKAEGVDPGGDIFIHGQPNGRVEKGYRITGDWTDGCPAISDLEMKELFDSTPMGTIVEIRP